MSEAKFKIKIGQVQFSGSGNEQWLSAQMEKMLSRAKDLASLASTIPAMATPSNGNTMGGTHPKIAGKTLVKFLEISNAKKNQVRKFLATAAWCHVNKQKKILAVADVTAALRDTQGRLSNPSLCLIQNCKKGLCEKHGKNQFSVSDDGYKELGA